MGKFKKMRKNIRYLSLELIRKVRLGFPRNVKARNTSTAQKNLPVIFRIILRGARYFSMPNRDDLRAQRHEFRLDR